MSLVGNKLRHVRQTFIQFCEYFVARFYWADVKLECHDDAGSHRNGGLCGGYQTAYPGATGPSSSKCNLCASGDTSVRWHKSCWILIAKTSSKIANPAVGRAGNVLCDNHSVCHEKYHKRIFARHWSGPARILILVGHFALYFAVKPVNVEGVEGMQVSLPCPLDAGATDKVYMVLWFRDDVGIPLYR